jgi:hypothetical protein
MGELTRPRGCEVVHRVSWRRAALASRSPAIGRFGDRGKRRQPFVWVKDAEEILARFKRYRIPPGLYRPGAR